MTQDYKHPIAPPSELVEQWYDAIDNQSTAWKQQLATRAAQWGADQANADIERKLQEAADRELEACIQVIADHGWFANPEHRMAELRAARRPKPLSLKEQAQQSLLRLANYSNTWAAEDAADMETIRRAVESIPDPS